MPVYYVRLVYDRYIEASNAKAAKYELLDLMEEALTMDPQPHSMINATPVDPPEHSVIYTAIDKNEELAKDDG